MIEVVCNFSETIGNVALFDLIDTGDQESTLSKFAFNRGPS